MLAERTCPVLPARLLANARILPKRVDILPLIPKGGVFVEIGVALGDYSAKIMKICEPDLFVGIDFFNLHETDACWGKPSEEVLRGKTHEQFYRDRFEDPIAAGRMRIMVGDTSESLAQMADSSIDIAYVDASHTYEAVKTELALLNRKLNPTGWIILNDYTMGNVTGSGFRRYGVIQACHEFMITQNWQMMYLALHPTMYCDVAIRRVA